GPTRRSRQSCRGSRSVAGGRCGGGTAAGAAETEGFKDEAAPARESVAQVVEHEVDDRRGEERKTLTDDESADDGNAERLPELRTGACAKREWKAAEDRGHGSHHDGTEAQHARLVDGLFGRLVVFALSDQGEVDHHDGVLLHDADEQDDADHRDDRKIDLEDKQSEERTDARRWERGENGERVNEALVEDAKNDIDRYDREQDEDGHGREGLLECLRRAGKSALDRGGHADAGARVFNRRGGLRERDVGRDIE